MRVAICTFGQIALHHGKIVGGAPVVAKRQAGALARAGVETTVLDLNAGAERLEKISDWTFAESDVPVASWQGPFDAFLVDPARAAASIDDILASVKCDWLLVQQDWAGAVSAAGKARGFAMVWQPNDYSFLCARSWFLRGDGTRCDLLPAVDKCGECQIKGRSPIETLGLRLFATAERRNFPGNYPKIGSLVQRARQKALDAPDILRRFDRYLAQSSSMHEVLRIQGLDPRQILHVDYGAAPPSSNYQQRAPTAPVHFAYIARPSFEKGLQVLLEAWARLPDDVVAGARLKVYSPIKDASKLQRRRIESALSRCRNVETSDLAVSPVLDTVYADIDVAIQPSLWIDHNTQTILEALCRRVPVVVPRHTCFADGIVRDGVNGLLVDLDDPNSLSSAISRVVLEPGLLARLKQGDAYAFSDDDWACRVASWLSTRL